MTQEEKELLLKDLCARLPYRPKARKDGWETDINLANLDSFYYGDEIILPYLRSLSTMTEDEKYELIKFAIIGDGHIAGVDFVDWVQRKDAPEYCEWLNAHHFDYRGLIPLGLALEAPEGMYK